MLLYLRTSRWTGPVALQPWRWGLPLVCAAIFWGFAMAENSYEGLKCRHPMTLLQSGLSGLPLMEANIFTGRGRPCTLWESGRFLVPLSEFKLPTAKLCSNFDNGSFVHGKWVVAGGGDCAIQWLRPLELRSALRNLTLVFMGDSLVRQLFLRLVSYLRGIPDQLERPFHTDAVS